jgi:hypothetical protein
VLRLIIDGSLLYHYRSDRAVIAKQLSHQTVTETIAPSAAEPRKRKRSMARRFQTGSEAKMGSWYVVRFRQDDGDERKQTYVRVCPVKEPGRLSRAARRRRAEELMQQAGVNSVETFNATHGETFRERAEAFLREAATRRRDPAKPATLATWESCLAKYLNPAIGELPLASITNGSLKQLVASLHKSGLGARAIQLYTGFMKLVIASAVDPDSGDQLYPRK